MALCNPGVTPEMKLYVIRIVVDNSTEGWFNNPFLESLRYAGLIHVHPSSPAGHQVFDIFPPKSAWNNSKTWSQMNADRMKTFGFNAVSAPAMV